MAEVTTESVDLQSSLTPSKIVAELDKYIIGQQDAKKAVAIALRNRWRRLSAPEDMRKEIIPNNILMIGATGVGKTEIARRLASLADAPFIKVEASKFTEVGYVGRDVESMIRDLVETSINMVKDKHKEQCKAKAAEIAEDKILDMLIPLVSDRSSSSRYFEGAAESELVNKTEDQQLNEKTRAKFREKIRKGELDERKIEIEVTVPSQNVQIMGPAGMEGFDGLQDMFNSLSPKKTRKRQMTIAEAREYLVEEEAQKLIDMDAVTKEAIHKAEESGIVFIDEIDKIAAGSAKQGGPDVSREGVQRDMLPIIEGSVVNTKYGSVKTDYMLFVAAGAFHIAKPSDLIPELQGRLPIRVELKSLTREDFIKILTQPRNALTSQYKAMLKAEEVNITFEPEAIEEIATIAFEVNQEIENIGARRLHTIMSNLLDNILFEVPDINPSIQFNITREFVQEKLSVITRSKDLSHYIL